jgi:hypothetical protein
MLALKLLAGSALAATSPHLPKPRDAAAARTLIRAIDRFDQTALRRQGAMTVAARAFVAQVKAGCGGDLPASVVNGTPRQQAVVVDIALEGALDLSLDAVHTVNHAALAMSRAFDRVHFSKRALSRGIHLMARIQRLVLKVKPSDLCGDIKAAAAGGFAADPPGTTAFVKVFMRLANRALLPTPELAIRSSPPTSA